MKTDFLASEEYSFLKTNPHLGDNVILLCLGGSHAYGLNTPESDIDLRGVATERLEELIGLSSFEQFTNERTDTVIYGLRKFVNLLLNCNPNIIEILGLDEEDYFVLTQSGKLLRDNIDLFLSKKAAQAFSGYATSQLYRIKNALSRDNMPFAEKEVHILNSIERSMEHIERTYNPFEYGSMRIYVEDELLVDANLQKMPLRDFKNTFQTMTNIIRDYDKVGARNNKKEESKLYKHAMHLIRLLLMGAEILEGKGVHTKRKNPVQNHYLREIRHGKITFEDVFDWADELKERFNYAEKHSSLPDKPDYKRVEELVMTINKNVLITKGVI